VGHSAAHLQRLWAVPQELLQWSLLLLQAVPMSEDQNAVAQQLPAIGTAQVVEAGDFFCCEACTGGEHQQDCMDAVL